LTFFTYYYLRMAGFSVLGYDTIRYHTTARGGIGTDRHIPEGQLLEKLYSTYVGRDLPSLVVEINISYSVG